MGLGQGEGVVTSLFLELLLAAILEKGGKGRVPANLEHYILL